MAARLTAASGATVRSFATKEELSRQLGEAVAKLCAATPADRPFTVAISGGSLPKLLAAGVLEQHQIAWKRWHVFFADERHVALDHADSNYLGCKELLFDKVGIPPENIHTIDARGTVEQAAAAYEAQLQDVFGADATAASPPQFDLVLLGMGPDGHTASLFPGHALLDVADVMVASIADSPKPPPGRITLTLPVINAAKSIHFVCTGGGKAPNLAKILRGDKPSLPAGLVNPTTGSLTWWVDDDASAEWRSSKM